MGKIQMKEAIYIEFILRKGSKVKHTITSLKCSSYYTIYVFYDVKKPMNFTNWGKNTIL